MRRERDHAAMRASRQGASRRGQRDWTVAGPRCRGECQPGGIVASGPGEGAAARVAEAECLIRRVVAALGGRKGEVRWTGPDGRGHGSRGDREGDRHIDRRGPRGRERDHAAMRASRQGASRRGQSDWTVAGPRCRGECQPGGIVASGPGEGAAARVAEAECLIRRVVAALSRREREVRGTGPDGRGYGSRGDREGDRHIDRRGPRGRERHHPAMRASRQGASRRGQSDWTIAGPRCRGECQPGGIVASGPGEGAAARVAEAECLIRRVVAALSRREGEVRGTGPDGRRHGSRGDREGDRHIDRRGPRGRERDHAAMRASRQGASRRGQRDWTVAGPRCRGECQPGGIVASGPAEGAAARVADAECLIRRVVAALSRREGEVRGTGPDGRGHGGRGDGEGDGDVDGGGPGGRERDHAAISASRQGAGRRCQRDWTVAGARCRGECQPGGLSLAVQLRVPPPVLLMLRV